MMFEPLAGRRHVKVTERRTALDYAHVLRELVDVHYPHAEKIVLVQDNLNTHKPASLYQAFPPEEARRILEKLEIHYTPRHGSWLNMAETELGILSRQCLDRRIEDRETLTREVAAWEASRNTAECRVNGASPHRTHAQNSAGSIRSLNLSVRGWRNTNLVRDPEPNLRRVAEFLGLEYEPQMATGGSNREGVPVYEYSYKGRAFEPITGQRIGNWRQELKPAQIARLERRGRRTLPELGYELQTGGTRRLPVWYLPALYVRGAFWFADRAIRHKLDEYCGTCLNPPNRTLRLPS